MSTRVNTPTEPGTETPPIKPGGMEDDIEPPPVDQATSSSINRKPIDDCEPEGEGESSDEGEQIEPGVRGLKDSTARSTPPDRLSDRATTSGH